MNPLVTPAGISHLSVCRCEAKFMFIWEEGKGMHVEITDMKNFDNADTTGYR